MSTIGGIADDELERDVVDEMKSVEGPTSLELIIERTDIQDRKTAKTVMRALINDGKVSTTPEWEYKLASRLRR